MANAGPTRKARILYWFDQKVAAGPRTLLGLLAFAALAVVAIAGVALSLLRIAPSGQRPLDLPEGLWESLMRALDPGTMGNDVGWGFRIVMLLVTIAGLFTVAALINILGESLQKRLTSLRKGRSRVIEAGHTVILNWSPAIFDVVTQLAEANRSLGRKGTAERQPCIVVMSIRDKVEMEDEIAARCSNLKPTRVICRRGDPTDLLDLRIAAFDTARAVIVLSPTDDQGDEDFQADWHVIKSVLALTHGAPERECRAAVVAQVRSTANVALVKKVGTRDGRCMVEAVLADKLVAQIIVQSCREPGLGDVYEHLLEFEGAEIYAKLADEAEQWTFAEILFGLEGATAIGVVKADGEPLLKPPFDRPFGKDEKLLVVAEDDDPLGKFARPAVKPVQRASVAIPPRAEDTLILGWNRRGPLVLEQLAKYAPATKVKIVADRDLGGVASNPEINLAMTVERKSTNQQALIAADASTGFANVVLLGNDSVTPKVADTRTLVKLLYLSEAVGTDDRETRVVAEVLDVGNRRLATLARAHDYVVSTRLVSLMLAQVAENRVVNSVFDQLLDETGPEFRLRKIADYGISDRSVRFAEVFRTVADHGDIVVGLVRSARTGGGNGERHRIRFNPSRIGGEPIDPNDRLVVLGAGPAGRDIV